MDLKRTACMVAKATCAKIESPLGQSGSLVECRSRSCQCKVEVTKLLFTLGNRKIVCTAYQHIYSSVLLFSNTLNVNTFNSYKFELAIYLNLSIDKNNFPFKITPNIMRSIVLSNTLNLLINFLIRFSGILIY